MIGFWKKFAAVLAVLVAGAGMIAMYFLQRRSDGIEENNAELERIRLKRRLNNERRAKVEDLRGVPPATVRKRIRGKLRDIGRY
jgi:hypothetical protein